MAQAPITKTSLTPVTSTSSMPLAFIAAAFSMKPGRWFMLQVGVNAPGTPISTTLRSAKMASLVRGAGPSGVSTVNVASGMMSPSLIMILSS